MLGGMEIKPEQHRYPFLASLLCIPSQDAIVENEGAAGPETDHTEKDKASQTGEHQRARPIFDTISRGIFPRLRTHVLIYH